MDCFTRQQLKRVKPTFFPIYLIPSPLIFTSSAGAAPPRLQRPLCPSNSGDINNGAHSR